jgi:hypothetical protein
MEDRIEKGRGYIIGGVDEISKFISQKYRCNKDLVKKLFVKNDKISLKDLNNFEMDELANIVRNIAYGLFYGNNEYVGNSLKGDILLFDFPDVKNRDYKNLCIEFVKKSKLEHDDKIQVINALENFEIEFYATEFLREYYDEESIFELNKIIPFVKNITIEYEHRLQNLNTYIILLNKAIIKNDDIIKRKSREYLKDCAEIVNKSLRLSLRKIENDLHEYILNLKNPFQDLLEYKESRAEILNQLFENNQKLNVFLGYEKKLIERKMLSKNSQQWLSSSLLLVKFYSFCEYNDLLKERFAKKSSGVKLFRKLYNFEVGTTIDKPSKRNKYSKPFLNADFYYLR